MRAPGGRAYRAIAERSGGRPHRGVAERSGGRAYHGVAERSGGRAYHGVAERSGGRAYRGVAEPEPGPPAVARYERKDRFHQRAKREGYRSRAAYKLLELTERRRVLQRGDKVVDLGCWPGAWLQVAAEKVGSAGRVVGVDLAETEALEPAEGSANVIALTGDLTQPPVIEEILRLLGGPADVLLSDAAPKLTGVRATDRAREEELLLGIEAALPRLLRPGGRALVKILDGPEAQAIVQRLRARFERAATAKPEASRRGTTERYLVGEGYRGPE